MGKKLNDGGKVDQLVLVVDSMERYRFFKRIANAARRNGVGAVIVTHLFSVFVKAEFHGFHTKLIKKKNYPIEECCFGEKEPWQVCCGKLTASYARDVFYSSVLAGRSVIGSSASSSVVMLWNGTSVVDLGMARAVKECGARIVFLEIANVPGKLLADPQGVNADASIRTDLSQLSPSRSGKGSEGVDSTEIKVKGRSGRLPQAVRNRNVNLAWLLDRVMARVLGLVLTDQTRMVSKLKQVKRRRACQRIIREVSIDDIPVVPFVFLPLQVTGDTNLLLHSDVSNEKALGLANEYCRKNGFKLVVKIHPAETDAFFIRKIELYRNEMGFSIVCTRTDEIIDASAEVWVINSTVGLEAKKKGKKVNILGRALYENFDNTHLDLYLTEYLVDGDYFGDAVLTKDSLSKIISRSRIPSVEFARRD